MRLRRNVRGCCDILPTVANFRKVAGTLTDVDGKVEIARHCDGLRIGQHGRVDESMRSDRMSPNCSQKPPVLIERPRMPLRSKLLLSCLYMQPCLLHAL